MVGGMINPRSLADYPKAGQRIRVRLSDGTLDTAHGALFGFIIADHATARSHGHAIGRFTEPYWAEWEPIKLGGDSRILAVAVPVMHLMHRAHARLRDVAKDESLHPIWRIWAARVGDVVFKVHCMAFEAAIRARRRA